MDPKLIREQISRLKPAVVRLPDIRIPKALVARIEGFESAPRRRSSSARGRKRVQLAVMGLSIQTRKARAGSITSIHVTV